MLPACWFDLASTESSLGTERNARCHQAATCQVPSTASSHEAEGAEAVLEDFMEEGADRPAASLPALSLQEQGNMDE
jgi:hypothetical protein